MELWNLLVSEERAELGLEALQFGEAAFIERKVSAREMQAVFKICVSFTWHYDQHDSTHSKRVRRIVRNVRLWYV